ncbi:MULTISPECIES: hypothetical protein [Streptomyces]|uniref:hypothetical protein n=1 Tax=Streptomyces TaxID=1883 RepID=UPI000FFF0B5F|nr:MULTISPECIES: hypothetical protein [Streptomyces]
MPEASEHRTALTDLWRAHMAAPFPPGLRGAERAGIDMVLLDASIAGCVSSWLDRDGSPDTRRLKIADRCALDLDLVLPLLTETEEIAYFRRLRRMAALVSLPEN